MEETLQCVPAVWNGKLLALPGWVEVGGGSERMSHRPPKSIVTGKCFLTKQVTAGPEAIIIVLGLIFSIHTQE